MPVYAIDFETYYDDDVTLRKMSVSEYVRTLVEIGIEDAVHCMSVAKRDKYGTFEGPRALGRKEIKAWFDGLPHASVVLVGHSLMFDGLIAAMGYGYVADSYIDTMGLSRAVLGPHLASHSLDNVAHALGIGGKLGGGKALVTAKGVLPVQADALAIGDELRHYCKRDTAMTASICSALVGNVTAQELRILSWTIRNYVRVPRLMLDEATLVQLAVEEAERKAALAETIGGDVSGVRSNPKLGAQLEALGVAVPMKVSKATGKTTYAFSKTDEEFTALQDDPDPRVATLVRARLGLKSSIVESRISTFRRHARANDDYLRPALMYGAAHTGRFGGGGAGEKQNLQNLTSSLKAAIVAHPGDMIGNEDSSQIELRIALALCGQDDILEKIAAGEDVYSWFASQLFGRTVTKADKRERQIGKVAVLSLQYGAGARTFRNMLRVMTKGDVTISDAEAQRVVTVYRATFAAITSTWSHIDANLAHMIRARETTTNVACGLPYGPALDWHYTSILLPTGLELQYPNLRWYQGPGDKRPSPTCDFPVSARLTMPKKLFGGLVLENLCQALARSCMAHWHDVALEAGVDVRLQVHDALVYASTEARILGDQQRVRAIMRTAPPWWPQLPVSSAGNIGYSYAEASKEA